MIGSACQVCGERDGRTVLVELGPAVLVTVGWRVWVGEGCWEGMM